MAAEGRPRAGLSSWRRAGRYRAHRLSDKRNVLLRCGGRTFWALVNYGFGPEGRWRETLRYFWANLAERIFVSNCKLML